MAISEICQIWNAKCVHHNALNVNQLPIVYLVMRQVCFSTMDNAWAIVQTIHLCQEQQLACLVMILAKHAMDRMKTNVILATVTISFICRLLAWPSVRSAISEMWQSISANSAMKLVPVANLKIIAKGARMDGFYLM